MGLHDQTVANVTAQLERGRSLVPDHLWSGIFNHVIEGYSTGSFLAAVFRNDALGVAVGADEISLARLPDIMRFMHNYAPVLCWGSNAKHSAWLCSGGIQGGAHLQSIDVKLEEQA